jgi:predicted SAM-dependent methyltransferase
MEEGANKMIKKLHLGCGERYLEGYINIDFPPAKHSIQKETVADRLVDIRKLKYQPGTIEEIRLHHVFEHFPRTVACALLVIWHTWLEQGGVLRIEVPDLEKMAQKIVSRFSSRKNILLAERHIFGSQEAPWAVHYTGYSPDDLTYFLEKYGFKVNKIKKNSWKGTSNVEVFAIKDDASLTFRDFEKITKKYLGMFLVDNSASEKELLQVWMKTYRDQIQKSLK